MICCPFHNDHHPSMKLNATYYYCFGCGATGDVIQFVANLFRLSNYEAAKKIAVDFGITPDKPPVIAALKKPEYIENKNRQKDLRECQKMVCEYLADYLTFADEEEGLGVVKSMKETGYLEDLKYLSGARDEEDAYAEEAKAA